MAATRRVAILWSDLSGYLNACLHALAGTAGVALFVAHSRLHADAPYDDAQFSWIPERFTWSPDRFDADELLARLRRFAPDTIVISGWVRPEYRRAVRALASTSVRLMTMDNQWSGRPRQLLGWATARWFIRPLADAAWVAGERQALFARRLGFPPDRILRGSLSCDHPAFSAVADARRTARNRSFAVIARLIPEKNLHRLACAYAQYRSAEADRKLVRDTLPKGGREREPSGNQDGRRNNGVSREREGGLNRLRNGAGATEPKQEPHQRPNQEPWTLRCYGDGPMASFLRQQPGVEVCGFTQPADLPAQLARASALVLPSIFEPWGVAVHEAASAGLGLLLSERAGSSVHLLQDGYNGWLFDPLDVADISRALSRFASQTAGEIEAMSRASSSLALQYTPARWASYLLERTAELIEQRFHARRFGAGGLRAGGAVSKPDLLCTKEI